MQQKSSVTIFYVHVLSIFSNTSGGGGGGCTSVIKPMYVMLCIYIQVHTMYIPDICPYNIYTYTNVVL